MRPQAETGPLVIRDEDLPRRHHPERRSIGGIRDLFVERASRAARALRLPERRPPLGLEAREGPDPGEPGRFVAAKLRAPHQIGRRGKGNRRRSSSTRTPISSRKPLT